MEFGTVVHNPEGGGGTQIKPSIRQCLDWVTHWGHSDCPKLLGGGGSLDWASMKPEIFNP